MFRGLAFSILLLTAGSLQAQIPHTFQAGQPARAAEVNENFQTLWQGVAGSIGLLTVEGFSTQSGTGLASVQCPIDAIAVSASCGCDSDNGTRNFGVLFGCSTAGNAAVGACFSYLNDPAKPPPAIQVGVRCLGGKTNDGTPLTQVLGMEIKMQSDELGEALNSLQKQLDDFNTIHRR